MYTIWNGVQSRSIYISYLVVIIISPCTNHYILCFAYVLGYNSLIYSCMDFALCFYFMNKLRLKRVSFCQHWVWKALMCFAIDVLQVLQDICSEDGTVGFGVLIIRVKLDKVLPLVPVPVLVSPCVGIWAEKGCCLMFRCWALLASHPQVQSLLGSMSSGSPLQIYLGGVDRGRKKTSMQGDPFDLASCTFLSHSP